MDAEEGRIAIARPLIETRLCYTGAVGLHPDAMRSEWA